MEHSNTVNPWRIRSLLRLAERERRALQAKGFSVFHPSPYFRVFRKLLELGSGEGRVFLEWGSGFGTIACFAAMLGYESYGLEIEEPFVDAAASCARALDLDVQFGCGSYVPEAFEPEDAPSSHVEWDEESGYATLDLRPQDVDVIYVYPWPDDETFHRVLFRETTHADAALVTFEGPDPVILSHADVARD